MPKFARFAASFLSLAFIAGAAAGADVRVMSEPAAIASAFTPKSKVRVLNVWATWCVPCVAEMPDLRAIDETFGPELSIVGVSLDDMIPEAKKETVTKFLDTRRIAFPNVYYTGSPDALGEHLRFRGEIPITIVLDARGRELWRHQGRLNKQATIAKLKELLRRK